MKKIIPISIKQANQFWRMTSSVKELPEAFSWIKSRMKENKGLGFYNFVQHPIAFSFVLALHNKKSEAEEEFAKYSELMKLNEKNRDKLNQLFIDACNS